jgi:hypothetical protein
MPCGEKSQLDINQTLAVVIAFAVNDLEIPKSDPADAIANRYLLGL